MRAACLKMPILIDNKFIQQQMIDFSSMLFALLMNQPNLNSWLVVSEVIAAKPNNCDVGLTWMLTHILVDFGNSWLVDLSSSLSEVFDVVGVTSRTFWLHKLWEMSLEAVVFGQVRVAKNTYCNFNHL